MLTTIRRWLGIPLVERKPLVGRNPLVERKPDQEWFLWVGDGMAPAGPHLIGSPVTFEGRKGKVVDTTSLKILIEWEDQR